MQIVKTWQIVKLAEHFIVNMEMGLPYPKHNIIMIYGHL